MQKYIVCTFMMALFGCQASEMDYGFESTSSIVKDKNIRIAIKDHLNIEGQITEEDLTRLHGLYLEDCTINSFHGLEHCTDLVILRMYNCEVNPALDFAELKKLREVSMRNCAVKQVPDFSALPNLTILNLDFNEISDIRFVLQLPNLKKLDVSDNVIEEIESIKLAEELDYLDLSNNPILQRNETDFSKTIQDLLPGVTVVHEVGIKYSAERVSKILSAHSHVAEFATYMSTPVPMKWMEAGKEILPDPPFLDRETLSSVEILGSTHQLKYLSDIAAVLLLYADMARRDFPPGGHIDPLYPLVAILGQELEGIGNSTYTNSTLSNVISASPDLFGPSIFLEEALEEHAQVQEYLKEKYQTDTQPGISVL